MGAVDSKEHLKSSDQDRVCVCVCVFTPVAHVTPAGDVTVGVWRRKLVGFRQTHRPDEVCLLHLNTTHLINADNTQSVYLCVCVRVSYDLRVQLNHADVVVDHGSVVAWMYDDGTHAAALTVDTWMVQVVQAHDHLPQVSALPTNSQTHTHNRQVTPQGVCVSVLTCPSPLKAVSHCQSPAATDEDTAAYVAALTTLQGALPRPRPPP